MKKTTSLKLKNVPKSQPAISSFFLKPSQSRLQLKKFTENKTDSNLKESLSIVVDLTNDPSEIQDTKNGADQTNYCKRKLSPDSPKCSPKKEIKPRIDCLKNSDRNMVNPKNKFADLLLKGKYHKSDEQCVPNKFVSPSKRTKLSLVENLNSLDKTPLCAKLENHFDIGDSLSVKGTVDDNLKEYLLDSKDNLIFDSELLDQRNHHTAHATNITLESKHKELNNLKSKGAVKNQTEELDDFFKDNWDGDDGEKSRSSAGDLDLSLWQRCEVLSISKDDVKMRKILELMSTGSGQKSTCILEGYWNDSPVKCGDTISVLATRTPEGFKISNESGLLVEQPDLLVSGTAVVGSLFCMRRAVLQDRFKGVDGSNRAMVIGSLVHELFQVALSKNLTTLAEIKAECRSMLKNQECVYMLYDARLSDGEALDEMMKFTPQIARFIEKYVAKNGNDKPKNVGYMNKRPPAEKNEWDGSIDRIVDIEENIWSPHIGVKGKIDVTIEVIIHDQNNKKVKKMMPLELKTGRATVSAEHRGQVILYTMMMANIEGPVPPHTAGLLLYLRESIGMHEISVGHSEKRDLIILRNDLSRYLASWSQNKNKTSNKTSNQSSTIKSVQNKDAPNTSNSNLIADEEGNGFLSMDIEKCFMEDDLTESCSDLPVMELPEPINHHSACGNCPYLTLCSIHLSSTGHSLSENHPLMRLQPRALGHLTRDHQKYLLHWISLLALEERDRLVLSPLKDIWTMPHAEREKRGKCLINLVVDGSVVPVGDRFEHSFQRKSKEGNLFEDLQQSLLQVGEYVIVSTEGKVAITLGTITHMDSHIITLVLDRDLSKRNSRSTLYCLDLYESQSLVIYNLTNLGLLMDDTEISAQLRSIVIDKQHSTFEEKMSRQVIEKGKEVLQRLNPVQQRAVLRALANKDYILIRGMPGTGKTQTIVALVEVLVRLGKSVLITSQTHSAVDNVLVRLKASRVSMLRLGSSSRVQPQLLPYCEATLTRHCRTPEELHQVYSQASVVGVTCLGSGHTLLGKRTFDICIVDESTQVLQCSVLRPLFAAHKFVLVGDPDQLPPIVRSNKARSLGLDESLFKRLDNSESTFSLCLQYRMNRPIMELANILSYEGQLRAANSTVEKDTIKINREIDNYREPDEWWLKRCVSHSLRDSVIFLDTGNTHNLCTSHAGNHNSASGEKSNNRQLDKCSNIYEAALVINIVSSLLSVGVLESNIGVIAPYRDQVALLKKLLAENLSLSTSSPEQVEVNTVDQYQGRDKSVIIYSCSRTRNKQHNDAQRSRENEILEDHRRLTVAITRAKHKLIMVGDVVTLDHYTPFRKLLNTLESPEERSSEPPGTVLSLLEQEKLGQFDWTRVMNILR